MAENQHPASEPLQKSAHAANMIRGAVKTGKAIAGAARGAAAGGPAGAAVAFAAANKHTVGKVILVIVALLLIPVIIICMLPAMIFGSLIDMFCRFDLTSPVVNSAKAIIANTEDINNRVNNVLTDALADTITIIQNDFASSEADQIKIINPYASDISYDAITLISMYSASRQDDVMSICMDELEQILRSHMDQFFSYTYREETCTVMTVDPETGAQIPLTQTDPDTGEQVPVTELWRIYTVAYHGDTYFSNSIFNLTDAQKQLAQDYASNLTVFLQDDQYSSVLSAAFQKNTSINVSGYTSPSTKNNHDLVVWATEAEKCHWGYVWGTYGRVLDSSLYNQKLQQYPTQVGRYSDYITSYWLGDRTADCVGLIKGYGWLNPDTLELVYGANGMPDIDCDSMYYNATEKGAISSIPEIPGLAVWCAGHIGIYIGNGEVIEARGTQYGVVRTKLSERNWTHWLKIPYITYS